VRDDFVPWLSLGPALAGSLGAPSLSGSGTVAGGSVITLSVAGAKPLSPTDLVVGFTALLAPLKGGVLVPHPDLLLPIPTDAAGAILFPALWPLGVPAGLHLYFQSWIVDASGPKGLTATNGLELTTP